MTAIKNMFYILCYFCPCCHYRDLSASVTSLHCNLQILSRGLMGQ